MAQTNTALDLARQNAAHDSSSLEEQIQDADLADRVRLWTSEAFSKNAQRAYRADWTHFVDWCDAQDRVDLPAEPATVAAYVDALAATHKASTIQRRLASIGKAHRARGAATPTTDPLVKLAWRAVRRRIGTVTALLGGP